MSTTGLSDKQRVVLGWLAKAERDLDTRGSHLQRRELFGFGVPWYMRSRNGITPVERASDSRALARLERRGLLLRQNSGTGKARVSPDQPHNRTTHVRLTADGRRAAQVPAASSRV
jgi:hypothetical protein